MRSIIRWILTKAKVHDVHYLHDTKHSGLHQCLLLADKGYLSVQQQLDLFEWAQTELQTPKRRNQIDYRPWPSTFKKARLRLETVFSQLCDQMKLKRNYAKTFAGLRSQLICKVVSVTLLQYINFLKRRPIYQIKHALAS